MVFIFAAAMESNWRRMPGTVNQCLAVSNMMPRCWKRGESAICQGAHASVYSFWWRASTWEPQIAPGLPWAPIGAPSG